MNVHTTFEVRSFSQPVPEIIQRVPENFGQSLDTHTLPFLKILMGFYSDCPINVAAKFEVVALTVPEIKGGTQKIWTVPDGRLPAVVTACVSVSPV